MTDRDDDAAERAADEIERAGRDARERRRQPRPTLAARLRRITQRRT